MAKKLYMAPVFVNFHANLCGCLYLVSWYKKRGVSSHNIIILLKCKNPSHEIRK
jgi:hypothetical protein